MKKSQLPLRALLPLALGSALFIPPQALADPCGMVPPIYEGNAVPIQRVGPQKTYVFFEKETRHPEGLSLETFMIRPSFKGDVDNFGMLIPFPSVPEMRKVSDLTFDHIGAAVDPPEVTIDLRPRRRHRYDKRPMSSAAPMKKSAGLAIERDEVVVLKEEAVGMYQIAVLQAGSPKALDTWMSENGFQYPAGMDRAVQSYIDDVWCFVAVKTRVGAKANTEPAPGLRKANPTLNKGDSFTGNVQAMGFRFYVKELVVPMKLSTFNEGELRNVVYVLHDEGVRIKGLEEKLVRRQLPGKKVRENLTKPLPLRILGGTYSDIPPARLKQVEAQRRPERHNEQAKQLFLSDLLAANTDTLSHNFEEREKRLLDINERLGLRGPNIDRYTALALKNESESALENSLNLLDSKVLTVFDGNFPREHLSSTNITFAPYRMQLALNHRTVYHGQLLGPDRNRRGVRAEWDGSEEGKPTEVEGPVEKFWRELWN